MKKIMAFLEKYFVPIAGRIGSQRHLVAIRDGFVVIMPIIMAGSFAVLINNLPIAPYQNLMTSMLGESWKSFGGQVWMGSFAVMSLLVNFTISYNVAKSYNSNAVAAGAVSLASLMAIMQPAAEAFAIPYQWTGAVGLFVSIFVALVSSEVFVRLLGNPRLVIKMPEGVPPAVAKSFAALFPSIITLSIFALLKVFTVLAGVTDIHALVNDIVQAPLLKLANSMGSALTIAFVNHLLWFFGLHGSNILEPVMQTVFMQTLDANISAFQAGAAIPNIVTKPFFDAFVYMGGSGTTITLIAAIYIASKRKQYRSLANMAAGPGLFNINEPVIFGMPIVLNPIFMIPFICVPVVTTIISYIALASGIVPKTVAMIPWTTPPIISGYLVTGGSVMGSLLQIVNLIIGIAIYMPFVLMAEKLDTEKAAEEA